MRMNALFLSISDSVGPRVSLVNLSQISNGDELNLLWRLSDSFQAKKLSICIAHLHSSAEMADLLCKVRTSNVDHLEVNALRIPDPEKFLINLSSLVRSLCITHYYNDGSTRNRTNFLGAFDVDWAPTIIEMFSRRLDKLKIENEYFCDYLSKANAYDLISKLPHIGKKVWFSASYYNNTKGVSYKSNNHIIQACNLNVSHRVLSIKHKSRLKEDF
ncbi:hypothetical protein PMAYCL1PPCAC_15158 [Pristionchus mayeri]|uniref:Uncharacterized protein n=1 Tax=Pristionchus mayeri TaxID=1317129 RepID=A0AAN5CIF3_9BILA|nr:hypothetical protein PMAYCL1PPCAC_15158 [Pristionchus mayeri]